MFKKPHHSVSGENLLTNLFLPDFRSQNAEVEYVLRIEKAQRKLQKHQHRHRGDSMVNDWPHRPRERQVVSIMQKRRDGSFFWERKWLRQDNANRHQDGRRNGESTEHYLDRRVRDLTIDGDYYRAEMRSIKDELRSATGEIAELRAELRRALSGGIGLGGGLGGGVGGGIGGGIGGNYSEDDGRPRQNLGEQHGLGWAAGQHYQPSPLDQRFPGGR